MLSKSVAVGRYECRPTYNYLSGIVEILPSLAVVAIVTAIVAPIKQRLLSKRRPSQLVCRPQATPPAASS